ncbi:CoA-transferase [Streptomyces sp. NPDC001493]
MPLAEAVAAFTSPGDHLHFASTPSRSNAAVRAVARHYRDSGPSFVLSTTGFHSTAHLLALLGLGRRYLSCFFGDNYPQPRPNDLYSRLVREGAELQHWSLRGYVEALRAGAQGVPYAVVPAQSPTTLTAELAAAGRFHTVPDPADPTDPRRRVGLLAALRPDITFLHAPLGDLTGRTAFFAPYGEAHWGAAAAVRGAVVTVERVVEPAELDAVPNASLLPPHRVLAVCPEPYGAHPQPLYVPAGMPATRYRDDVEHYLLWREAAGAPDRMRHFLDRVLAAEGPRGYRDAVGPARLAALHFPAAAPPARASGRPPAAGEAPPTPTELMIIRAARVIARQVERRKYRVVLAGIGQSYDAARLARTLLSERGTEVPVMVETGMYDVDCGPGGGAFPLGLEAVAGSRRLTGIEDVLSTLTCGSDNRCLGVVGAAQIDPGGDINSTRTADGRHLVGSGGAHDIGSAADEVVVLTPCTPRRMVPRVDYVTTPGVRVTHVVTDAATFVRGLPATPAPDGTAHPAGWSVRDLDPAAPRAYERCGWQPLPHRSADLPWPPPTVRELRLLRALRTTGADGPTDSAPLLGTAPRTPDRRTTTP